ncbi:MAG: histidine phosphatase family protein [Candidatus Latescibacteria bacterium]|nr:histidine phosphatase family protein [Candidatus Latescibacterota bacterium]
MKTIYIVRHAKAESSETDTPDFERSLIERGINDAHDVAARLSDREDKPTLLISSPAARAIQTARIFAEHLAYPKKKIRTRKSMYDQTGDILSEIIHAIDNEFDTVLLTGHDPSFSGLANTLAKKFSGNLPTCGLLGLEFKVKTWEEIAPGTGKKIVFDYPGAAKKPGKKKVLRKQLETEIEKLITHILIKNGVDESKKANKIIAKVSRKVAKELAESLTAKSKK